MKVSLTRLAAKELRESLRDRRTLVTLVVMPLLLYPLLTMAFRTLHQSAMTALTREDYNVGVQDEADFRQLVQYLSAGERALQDIRLGKDGHPIPLPPLRFFVPDDMYASLMKREIDVGVVLRPPDKDNPSLTFELMYFEDHLSGLNARDQVERRLTAANVQVLRKLLHQALPPNAVPVVRSRQSPMTDPEATGNVSLAVLVPLILILMTVTGAVYPAIDLTAGERERGTLEVLMAAPVSRVKLLLAKFVAVLSVALLTALINLTMMALMIWYNDLQSLLFHEELKAGEDAPAVLAGVFALTMLQILGLLLLFAVFYSAVLLVLTSFARSFKEAQAYLIPLMLVSLAPGLLALMPGLKLEGTLQVTPLLNTVLLARDLFEERATLQAAAVVVGSTLVYSLLAIVVAARLFGSEGVLYGTPSRWRRGRKGADGAG